MKIYNSHGNWWHDGDTCPSCNVILNLGNSDYNAGRNGSTLAGNKGATAGQQKKIKYCYKDFLGNQKIRDINKRRKQRLLNKEAEAWLGTIFPRPYEPKPLRTVTTTVKPRNYSLVTSLKELYNYTCQVLGCNEQEVDLAHLYPHRYDDSVDNETNAAVLCKNHHWSLDHKRMYIEDDLTFTRYNLDGKLIEESIIVCNKDHKIDAKFITKSQNWFLGWEQSNDRKEQAMG